MSQTSPTCDGHTDHETYCKSLNNINNPAQIDKKADPHKVMYWTPFLSIWEFGDHYNDSISEPKSSVSGGVPSKYNIVKICHKQQPRQYNQPITATKTSHH